MFRKIFLLLSAMFVFAAFAGAMTPTPTPAPAASTATTDKSAKPAAFRPTKDQIKQGQEFLITEKLYTGQATGVYGDSRTAIKAYQKANGLDENGKFDRATLEKMNIALTDSQKAIAPAPTPSKDTKPPKTTSAATTDGPKRPAPFTANKDQIVALQKVLISGKMFTGEANGERSDALKDAVKKYQETNGLKVTGGINSATLGKASIELTDKQKEQVAAQAAYDAAKTPKN
ncbi:MAG: peptidoglycan-binding domain-containing protein [Pyrinomonadaceae bacterium]